MCHTQTKKNLNIAVILVLVALGFYVIGVNWVGTLMLLFALLACLILLLSRVAMWFQNVGLVWLEETYLKFIKFALKGWLPYALIAGTFLLMIVTMAFYFGSDPRW